MYVIGITGKGKSKLLEHLLFQDITQGHGCGLLDPHGDLVDDLLRYLHSNPARSDPHWERIIYFDPTHPDYIVPFNVLATAASPYEITQNVVEAFRRTWPRALDEAPRFANIATASILTLIANKLTLVELPRLLTDSAFRDSLLANVEDSELIAFWEGRFNKWGREAPLMIESVLNKVTAFTLNPHLRLVLGAAENRLDLRKIMDEGKVLIVNLGRCDTETRRLVGSLIVTGLEQAARARRESQTARTPYYFAIDEFQDFCANDGGAQSLAQILSECRKYGLHLTLAHQTLAQVNERMRGALGNIQLKTIFGVSRSDAEVLAKHLFQVDSEKVKHEVEQPEQQERSHPVYYSLPEEWERFVQQLQNLEPRKAYVRRPRRRAVERINTITIRYADPASGALQTVRQALASNAGVRRKTIEKAVTERLAQQGKDALSRPLLREPIGANGSNSDVNPVQKGMV